MIEPEDIIKKYYKNFPSAYRILIEHSKRVSEKAESIGKRLNGVDMRFLYEASMLHDIGIIHTDAPEIGCYGKEPYIVHGIIGRKMLEDEGLPKHGLVAERHVGAGISLKDIKEKGLPLPERDMVPVTLEEKIICVADKFFSKKSMNHIEEKSLEQVMKEISTYGDEKLRFFISLLEELCII